MTRKVKHTFSLFAANMAIDHAIRAYGHADASQKAKLATDLQTFFAKYEKFTLPDLEKLM